MINKSSINAFVYTEVQIAVPFDKAPWRELNPILKSQPGFINKTWLSGLGTNSVGGIYAFESIEKAQLFVNDYFPGEAKNLGAAPTTRVFDARATEEASRDLNSVYWVEGVLKTTPEAFLYTEVQLSVPFDQAPWRDLNPTLRVQPGFMSKTWLSGAQNQSLGGIYAFDTVENAKQFAHGYFPTEIRRFKAAYTVRIFDAKVVEEASRALNSPFFP